MVQCTRAPAFKQFNDMINMPFLSKPFVAGLVAYILDNILQVKDASRYRGYHWWDKFRSYKKDRRSTEFLGCPVMGERREGESCALMCRRLDDKDVCSCCGLGGGRRSCGWRPRGNSCCSIREQRREWTFRDQPPIGQWVFRDQNPKKG